MPLGRALRQMDMRRKLSQERWPFQASQAGLWSQVVLLQRKIMQDRNVHLTLCANYHDLIPGRKLEADVAIPQLKICAEYQGGAFLPTSGHKNFKGVQRDHFKANEAQLNGWIFLQFGPIETKTGEAMNVIEKAILSRLESPGRGSQK